MPGKAPPLFWRCFVNEFTMLFARPRNRVAPLAAAAACLLWAFAIWFAGGGALPVTYNLAFSPLTVLAFVAEAFIPAQSLMLAADLYAEERRYGLPRFASAAGVGAGLAFFSKFTAMYAYCAASVAALFAVSYACASIPPLRLAATGLAPATAFVPAAGLASATAFVPAAGLAPATAFAPAAGLASAMAFAPAAGLAPVVPGAVQTAAGAEPGFAIAGTIVAYAVTSASMFTMASLAALVACLSTNGFAAVASGLALYASLKVAGSFSGIVANASFTSYMQWHILWAGRMPPPPRVASIALLFASTGVACLSGGFLAFAARVPAAPRPSARRRKGGAP